MAKLHTLFATALLLALSAAAPAQNLDMSGSRASSTFDEPGKPTRGMSRDSVRSSYGNPTVATGPVGDPPISRWEYENFVVFFEYDRVIHSVTKR